jgi:hypothetical protein
MGSASDFPARVRFRARTHTIIQYLENVNSRTYAAVFSVTTTVSYLQYMYIKACTTMYT